MRDNTFTPGPWIWAEGNKGLYGAGPDNAVLAFYHYEGMHLSGKTEISQECNARLIASAPDMYDALWEAVELSDRTLPESGRTAECQRVYDLCVAALKKAEGE